MSLGRKSEIETKDYRKLFLEKLLLGQDTKLDDSDAVILKCIMRAYRDMLTAGRFYLMNDTADNIKSRCSKFKLIKVISQNSILQSCKLKFIRM